jgi:signal transduction histidine kinase
MPDPAANSLNLWWVITVGSGIGLALALGFVLIVLYHERSNRNLERNSEQRYSELFHNVNDLIYVHSSTGIIQEVNKSVINLLSLPRESIVGSSIGDFLPRGYKQYFQRYLGEASLADPVREFTGLFPIVRGASVESQVLRSNSTFGPGDQPSELVILEYRSRVILDNSGNVTSVWGIARDQTNRIHQERSLRKSNRKIQDLYHESERMREELSNLSQKMMQIQEEDRLRISRELHDEVGQTLTAISTNLQVVKQDLPSDQPQLQERLAESQALARDVTQCIRRVIRELRPIAIDELGLLPALAKYVGEFEARSGIHTVFRYDPLEEDLSLNEKLTIYRIIQESLTNIARHSGASEAHISLLERENVRENETEYLTCVEVSDNGCGMSSKGSHPNEANGQSFVESQRTGKNGMIPGGMGLQGMKERVKLLSGSFELASDPQHGTRISIALPRKRT